MTAQRAEVEGFFDPQTFTVQYVVSDPTTARAAVIDPVLDFDPSSGRTSRASVDAIVAYVREKNLEVDWILETHAHADHLSGASALKSELGGQQGQLGIGGHITDVQSVFAKLFNAVDVRRDGSQFDVLFADGDEIELGSIAGRVIHTPGHTPACVTYVFGDAAFVGDTLFMPDYGTARCDFPGGDASTLFRSIHKIFALPDATRLFMCHDYKAPGRDDYAWETTVGEEKRNNVHVREGAQEAAFVKMRHARDAELAAPRLILPSLQVNIRAGELPAPEDNGIAYLKIPLNQL